MIPQNVIPRCLVFVVVVAFLCITYLPASRSFSFSFTAAYGHGFFEPMLGSALSCTPHLSPVHHPTVQHRPSRFLPVLSKSFCLTAGALVLFLIPHHPLPHSWTVCINNPNSALPPTRASTHSFGSHSPYPRPRRYRAWKVSRFHWSSCHSFTDLDFVSLEPRFFHTFQHTLS